MKTLEELRKANKCTCDFKERTKLLMEMLRTGEHISTDSSGFRNRAPGECDYCYCGYVDCRGRPLGKIWD
jgi:hypothetical protein